MNFWDSLLALIALFVWCLSAWGWGRIVVDACRIEPDCGVAYHVTLGLGALASAGGWLNLLGVAYTPVLWALLTAGWIAAARRLAPAGISTSPRKLVNAIDPLPGIAIGFAALFLGFTLLPSAVFNPIDDLQLYFHRPLRMLQTGTLGGDPFDSLGFDSLGIHAFLQAFTLLTFPPRFLNAFDAVLCAVLALILVANTGRSLKVHPLVTFAGMASLTLLHPQQVNISSVYATAVFSLALIPAVLTVLQPGVPLGPTLWRRSVPLGLLVAVIVGLKSTTLSFVFPFALVVVALVANLENLRVALRFAGTIGFWSALFLLPWLGLHAKNYVSWISGAEGSDSDGIGYFGSPVAYLTNTELIWGGTVGAYDVVVGIALAAALAGTIVGLSRVTQIGRHNLIPILALCWAAITAYLLNSMPYDLKHAVRYSTPALLVGISASVLLIGRLVPRGTGILLALTVPTIIGLAFAVPNSSRLNINVVFRSTLSLPEAAVSHFSSHTAWALGEESALWVRKAQARIPPGERTLAFIAYPHHLFFARNPVLVASDPGLAMPWLRLPLNAGAEEIRSFLLQQGIRYVVWQIGSGVKPDEHLQEQLEGSYPIVRRQAMAVLSLRRSLAELAKVSEPVHEDDGLFVISTVNK